MVFHEALRRANNIVGRLSRENYGAMFIRRIAVRAVAGPRCGAGGVGGMTLTGTRAGEAHWRWQQRRRERD